MNAKRNVLVIGACGGVGRAFLRTLLGERRGLGKIVLVDKKEPWADDGSVSFRELNGEFIRASVDVDKGREVYHRLLKTNQIDIVVDLSVLKDFSLYERIRTQFRAEFFNFPNHFNWGGPGSNISVPASVGRITGGGEARVVQFGLKVLF